MKEMTGILAAWPFSSRTWARPPGVVSPLSRDPQGNTERGWRVCLAVHAPALCSGTKHEGEQSIAIYCK